MANGAGRLAAKPDVGLDGGGPLALIYADPRSLEKNDFNWRRHPQAQAETLRAVIEQVGYAGPILLNAPTTCMTDGDLRIDAAIANGEPSVPVYTSSATDSEMFTDTPKSKENMGFENKRSPVALWFE